MRGYDDVRWEKVGYEDKMMVKMMVKIISRWLKIIPVYPTRLLKKEFILGEKVYNDLIDIPEKVDMVNIFRKPAVVKTVVEQSIQRGDVQVIWAQVEIINNEAGELAQKNGMKFVQNLCSMVQHRELINKK